MTVNELIAALTQIQPTHGDALIVIDTDCGVMLPGTPVGIVGEFAQITAWSRRAIEQCREASIKAVTDHYWLTGWRDYNRRLPYHRDYDGWSKNAQLDYENGRLIASNVRSVGSARSTIHRPDRRIRRSI